MSKNLNGPEGDRRPACALMLAPYLDLKSDYRK
jgi:hypothetical protein